MHASELADSLDILKKTLEGKVIQTVELGHSDEGYILTTSEGDRIEFGWSDGYGELEFLN